MKKNSLNIASVVVTYNRLGLLKECLASLRNQTRKLDEIIVVNNDSTDGTKEWLGKQQDITVIHQPNLGGAGGFNTGIKTAYEKGYDWIWCMDDDCLPRKDALEKLFEDSNDNNKTVLNSAVINKQDTSKLNFGLEDFKIKKYYESFKEINGKKIVNGANFFNGTLLSKTVIHTVGFPNPEFFIYGDEYEYYLRIKKNNFPIKTIVSSIVLHPEQKKIYIGKGKFFHRFNFVSKLRATYFPRNLVIIFFLYKEFRLRRLIKNFIADIYFILRYQNDILITLIYMKSILVGFSEIILHRNKYD